MSDYTCVTCIEQISGKHIVFGSSRICLVCFKHLFELAINDEHEYPAHWGTVKIDHKPYADVLSPELVQRYEAKAVEYSCPPTERVYCAQTDPPRRPETCSNFIGQFSHTKVCKRCENCMWYTCLRCEESFSTDTSEGIEAAIQHDCNPRKEGEINLRALQDLQRGKDYQICPNERCRRVWAIWDGCNHMKCTCGRYFCYICGIKTSHNYRHFQEGQCPLYISGLEHRAHPYAEVWPAEVRGHWGHDAAGIQHYRRRMHQWMNDQGWAFVADPFAMARIEAGLPIGNAVPPQLAAAHALAARELRHNMQHMMPGVPLAAPPVGYWLHQNVVTAMQGGRADRQGQPRQFMEFNWRPDNAPPTEPHFRFMVEVQPPGQRQHQHYFIWPHHRQGRYRGCIVM